MKRLLWGFTLLMSIATSCKRNLSSLDLFPGTNKLDNLSLLSDSRLPDPGNAENTCDSIGVIHNLAMFSVCNYIRATGDTSRVGKRAAIIAFFKQRYDHDAGSDLLKSHQQKMQFKKTDSKQVILRQFPQVMGRYLLRPIEELQKVKSPSDYSQFKVTIIALEREALKDTRLTNLQRQQILHIASIARHSLWFWINASGQNGPVTTQGFFRDFIRSMVGCTADLQYAIWELITFQSFTRLAEVAADESAGVIWYFDAWL